MISDENVFVKHEAALALGTIGNLAAESAISSLLTHHDADIVESAEIALERLPNEQGVFPCHECSRLICKKHIGYYCEEHKRDQYGNLPILMVILAIITLFSVFIFFIYVQISSFFGNITDLDEGDVITVDSEIITVTEPISVPDFQVIAFIVFLITLPILVGVVIFVRRQILNYRKTLPPPEETPRTYYCQACGTQNTMEDTICSNCSKSTSDERRLVS
jgi:hypothetical protein